MPIHQTNTLRIEFDDTGPARSGALPVLLLHSSGSGRRQWRRFAQALGADWRCLAPDLIGYGQSAALADRSYNLGLEVELASAMLECIGGRAHVIGHSFGGCVALGLAEARPEALISLTLIEPVRFDLLAAANADLHTAIESLARIHVEACRDGRPEEAAAAFVGYWSGAAAWQGMPAPVRAATIAAMPKVALEWGLLVDSTAGRPVARPDCPTLLVEGSRTTEAARAVMEILAGKLPAAARACVDGAGHLAPVTHPFETAAVIGHFLSEAFGRGPGTPGPIAKVETEAT